MSYPKIRCKHLDARRLAESLTLPKSDLSVTYDPGEACQFFAVLIANASVGFAALYVSYYRCSRLSLKSFLSQKIGNHKDSCTKTSAGPQGP
jgi:hypothetical protein